MHADQIVADDRVVDHTEHRATILDERDQRAEQIRSCHEGFGAVDGVEHPAIAGVGLMAAILLAQDAVVGVGAGDEVAHR